MQLREIGCDDKRIFLESSVFFVSFVSFFFLLCLPLVRVSYVIGYLMEFTVEFVVCFKVSEEAHEAGVQVVAKA